MIIFNAVWFSKVLKSAPHFKGAKNTSIQVTNSETPNKHSKLRISSFVGDPEKFIQL